VTRPQRALLAYTVSNLWEIAISIVFVISAIGNIVTKNNRTSVSNVWGEPWDTIIIGITGVSGLGVLLGVVLWLPRVRAAGLAVMASMLLMLAASAVHARGLAIASYGVGAYTALAVAAIGRAAGIALQGDYPPLGRRQGDCPRRRE
jgi:hypothetical protein